METVIAYAESDRAWKDYSGFLEKLIRRANIRKVCDLGGGANPLFAKEKIVELKLDYTILDISEEELEKTPEGYKKIHADISAPGLKLNSKFELVFSKMLMEHVKDVKQMHENVYKMLEDGGWAVHFFPTLFTMPFVANFLIPEKLASIFLNYFAPRDRYKKGKFPAYYRWCRGPTKRQILKFERLGYDVVQYIGFFGHKYYDKKLLPLKWVHTYKTDFLLRHPLPFFTSYAWIVLRKPDQQKIPSRCHSCQHGDEAFNLMISQSVC